MKKRKHIRSASCDVKIGRSNSREYDADYRNRRVQNHRSHSRNTSRDLGFESRDRQQPTHARTNSRDQIKYILNCLKPEGMLTLPPPVPSHRHSRNHSYDQIYSMPNNIKIDQELYNKFNKNRQKATATSSGVGAPATVIENDLRKATAMDIPGTSSIGASTNASSHSRNNSKDLNKSSFLVSLVDDAANSILRHRRTNSKDLNRMNVPSTSNVVPDDGKLNTITSQQQPSQSQHRRNVSQTKIEFPEEDAQDVANDTGHVLLQQNFDSSSDKNNQQSNID